MYSLETIANSETTISQCLHLLFGDKSISDSNDRMEVSL